MKPKGAYIKKQVSGTDKSVRSPILIKQPHKSIRTSIMSSSGDFESRSFDPTTGFSDFGDEECGEPESAQHIVLDFTPDPEIDNEIVQKKVCDFWKMINNSPEIQNLKVTPKKCKKPSKPSTYDITPPKVVHSVPERNVVDMTKTACAMLEVVEEKDLIKRAFEVRMPQTLYSLGSFKDEDSIQEKKKTHRQKLPHKTCPCTKPCKPCPMKKSKPSPLKKLCATLEQWDKNHPQCMDPPGHPPALQTCIIQRQVFEI